MQIGSERIIVIGDRLLIRPDDPEERTKVGLYLPQTVVEGQQVQSGRVLEVGPGVAFPTLAPDGGEPWQQRQEKPVRYIPLQAEVGDHALFLRKEAVELRYRGEAFLVVPQQAVLLLIRPDEPV